MATVHASPFSGTWYPGDPEELRGLLDELFEASRKRTGEYLLPGALGFVVPHAGLVYSGGVAAAAYRYLEQLRPKRVVILGFAHRGAPDGLWIPKVDAIATPLGDVPVDAKLVGELIAEPEFGVAAVRSVCDHSVEIQLPLVQRAAPEAAIVPIYVSRIGAAERRAAARTLGRLAGDGTVLLASSDLTHYGREFGFQPFPVDDEVSGNLRDLDGSVMEAAGSLNPELFLGALAKTGSNVCGAAPIALLLETLRATRFGDVFQQTLDYQTSGEITGDFHHSVSYGALGYFPAASFLLSGDEQELLLESARRTLEEFQATGNRRMIFPRSQTPGLARRAGVFVTLHEHKQLRGCIGTKAGTESLYRSVPEMALAAALDDPRFDPVTRGEDGIEVEISVLSPMKQIAGASDFQVGLDGGYLEAGYNRGLLLPQVAEERGWTAADFLKALARKAHAHPGVYGDPHTRLFVFRAQVFGKTG